MTSEKQAKKRADLTHLLEGGLEKKLYGYLKNCGIVGQNARDAVQDALLWCLTCPEDLNEIRNPVAYIGRHAYWRVRDHARQNWRAIPLDVVPEPVVRPFYASTDLNHALSRLSEEDRELITQHGLQGLTYGELAKASGKSRDSLHKKVPRIL
jgi:DNA-directed RNA polymerase specialized sigma24 family protein